VISVGVVNGMEIKEKKEVKDYWYHSFYTALITKYIAKKFYRYLDPEGLWTASILHDIGKLVYIKFFPEHYRELKRFSKQNGCLFSEAEKHYNLPLSSYFGYLLCHHWRLPIEVETACEYHNLFHISKEGSDFQIVIALGNLLATLSEGGINESCKNKIKEVTENILELSPENFISLMADVYELRSEAEQFLRRL
jgi:HD-like signal output (HDOD) protein